MKFKAKLSLDALKEFLAMLQSMNKVASICALQLSDDAIHIKTRPDGDSEIQACAQIQVDQLLEYKKERTGPVTDICLEFLVANMIRGFKSADQADSCTIKLTKRNQQPCLSVIADTITSIIVVQDIPVNKILSSDEMETFRDPMLPRPDITLEFPDPRSVRTVLDRMKLLDKFVQLTATEKGYLILKVQTEVVSVETVYQGLLVHDLSSADSGVKKARLEGEDSIAYKGESFIAHLNIKDLIRVLHFTSTKVDKVLLCLVQNRALVVHIIYPNGSGTQTFFVPLTEVDDEEE